jgi:hypothetical protein
VGREQSNLLESGAVINCLLALAREIEALRALLKKREEEITRLTDALRESRCR